MNQEAQAVARSAGLGTILPQSLTQKLEAERKQLEERLTQVNDVLDELTKNPEAQALLDAVTKLGHFGY